MSLRLGFAAPDPCAGAVGEELVLALCAPTFGEFAGVGPGEGEAEEVEGMMGEEEGERSFVVSFLKSPVPSAERSRCEGADPGAEPAVEVKGMGGRSVSFDMRLVFDDAEGVS